MDHYKQEILVRRCTLRTSNRKIFYANLVLARFTAWVELRRGAGEPNPAISCPAPSLFQRHALFGRVDKHNTKVCEWVESSSLSSSSPPSTAKLLSVLLSLCCLSRALSLCLSVCVCVCSLCLCLSLALSLSLCLSISPSVSRLPCPFSMSSSTQTNLQAPRLTHQDEEAYRCLHARGGQKSRTKATGQRCIMNE